METAVSNNNLKVEVNNRQILSIALPITLAILIPQLNLLINSIFLGRVSEEALGSAGITGVFYLIFAVAGNGLNNAMQTVFSKYAGADKPDAFKTILTQGIRISLQFAVVCIIFTWLIAPFIMQAASDPANYPREMGFLRIRIFGLPFLYLFQMGNAFLVASLNSRYLMIGFIAEALVNILFDYLLIFGKAGFPQMGFNGAAVASVMAEFAGFITVLIVLNSTGLKKKYGLLKTFIFDKVISKEVLKVSLPLVLQYLISVSTWLVFFLLIASKGDDSKAISNIMRNVFGLAGVFVWSFASTSNTMVGNLMGQKREDLVLPAITRITCWSFLFGAVICGCLNLFPELFFRLFGQDENFVQQGIPVIRVVTLGILFLSIANVWLNGVTGTGKTRMNLAIEIVAISLYMGYTWYFTKLHYVSLAMAWSNEFVYWTAIFLMAFLYLKSGRWKTKPAT
ncbi:MATE family efflux transporter [Ferruginibacter sp. HRS2-29]|uniref:MATE family efflux transporter n=1 Tax=Ferruginibacter sp. HRS2-29 TaxID=2487334 RepID=UPI0020CF0A62|nr:MATE family efflux transporter [Ferruginibacter sp. HRS2-29]MCP9752051.1 MATE family efflux transporter [Ferruginibacter sp. HRS2-29]